MSSWRRSSGVWAPSRPPRCSPQPGASPGVLAAMQVPHGTGQRDFLCSQTCQMLSRKGKIRSSLSKTRGRSGWGISVPLYPALVINRSVLRDAAPGQRCPAASATWMYVLPQHGGHGQAGTNVVPAKSSSASSASDVVQAGFPPGSGWGLGKLRALHETPVQ